MAKVGRKTELTEKLFRQIKQSILDGNDLRKTAKVCGIPESTLYTWHGDNYLNISDKVENWKRDRKLMLSENVSEVVLTLAYIDEETGKIDKEILKLKQKEAEFVRETLGKTNYSKRSELTGKDGSDLIPEHTEEVKLLADKLNDIEKRTIHS